MTEQVTEATQRLALIEKQFKKEIQLMHELTLLRAKIDRIVTVALEKEVITVEALSELTLKYSAEGVTV